MRRLGASSVAARLLRILPMAPEEAEKVKAKVEDAVKKLGDSASDIYDDKKVTDHGKLGGENQQDIAKDSFEKAVEKAAKK